MALCWVFHLITRPVVALGLFSYCALSLCAVFGSASV